jgi:hypothetical protein
MYSICGAKLYGLAVGPRTPFFLGDPLFLESHCEPKDSCSSLQRPDLQTQERSLLQAATNVGGA